MIERIDFFIFFRWWPLTSARGRYAFLLYRWSCVFCFIFAWDSSSFFLLLSSSSPSSSSSSPRHPPRYLTLAEIFCQLLSWCPDWRVFLRDNYLVTLSSCSTFKDRKHVKNTLKTRGKHMQETRNKTQTIAQWKYTNKQLRRSHIRWPSWVTFGDDHWSQRSGIWCLGRGFCTWISCGSL